MVNVKCLGQGLVYGYYYTHCVIIHSNNKGCIHFLREESDLTLQSGRREVCLLVLGQLARAAEQLLDDPWTHSLKVLLRNRREAVL